MLISYPYYTKGTIPGDKTYFRHVDINIKQCADDNRGTNQIQGTVSFNDEDNENCIEILHGVHTRAKL